MTTLTQGQQEALSKLEAFLASEDLFFLLSGSAGTGKTYMLEQVLPLVTDGDVIGCGPTHKSVAVLATRLHDTDCMTIHRFLGLKPKKSGTTSSLVKQRNYDPTQWMGVSVLLLDELSMVSSDLVKHIKDDALSWNRKYIFIGDRYQLPPVDEKYCPVYDWDIPDRYKHELTEIVRQAADNPVIRAATGIRDSIIGGKEPPLRQYKADNNTGIYLLKPAEWESKLAEYVHMPQYKENTDFMRILAYRNATVHSYNQKVRHLLGEDLTYPFSVGDKVVANEAWVVDEEVLMNTGQEFTITEIYPHTHPVYSDIFGFFLELEEIPGYPVYVLDYEKSAAAYKNALQAAAITGTKEGDWRPYYGLQEYFADLRPVFSLTTHKCLPLRAKILGGCGVETLGGASVGQEVISGKRLLQPIVSVAENRIKPEYLIKTKSGRAFVSSPEHRYLLPDGEFRQAGSIRKGDFLSLYRNPCKHEFIFDLDYYAYGYLVGNGCYSYASNRVDITLHQDSSLFEILKQFLGKHGSKVYTYAKGKSKGVTLSTELKQLRQEMLDVGLLRVTAANKALPKLTTRRQQANFIRGLFDADGSCSAVHANIRLSTSSEDLVDGVLFLLQGFGIIGRKRWVRKDLGHHSQAFHLEITGENCRLCRDQIGFSEGYKAERLGRVLALVKGKSNTDFIQGTTNYRALFRSAFKLRDGFNKKGNGLPKGSHITGKLNHKYLSYRQLVDCRDFLVDHNIEVPHPIMDVLNDWYFYDEVVSSELTGASVLMTDIEVKDDHSFIYNGAVVHNSQGSTFDNVMVDFRDIYTNRKMSEADRCYYVAITRARYNVYLLA